MYPFKLLPYISSTIWGGKRLIKEYGVETEKENAAEAWVLSCHPNGCAAIQNGEFKGKTLREVYLDNKSICGSKGENFDDFPVLIKFIDAQDNLSIQVHPDDEYCRKTGKGAGKTECWYILDCEEDAQLILGFKEKISREEFAASIENDTVLDCVQSYKVNKGDFFFIDAGTLHAICKGVLLAEVQQNSDTTYRIYDYNRRQADGSLRELHVSSARDVTVTEPFKKENFIKCNGEQLYINEEYELVSTEMFTVKKLNLDGSFGGNVSKESFISLLILEGEGTLTYGNEQMSFKKGESIFLPASFGEFSLSGKAEVLITSI